VGDSTQLGREGGTGLNSPADNTNHLKVGAIVVGDGMGRAHVAAANDKDFNWVAHRGKTMSEQGTGVNETDFRFSLIHEDNRGTLIYFNSFFFTLSSYFYKINRKA
jgi:hypothetical protein